MINAAASTASFRAAFRMMPHADPNAGSVIDRGVDRAPLAVGLQQLFSPAFTFHDFGGNRPGDEGGRIDAGSL
jgi:hypothetical protein